MNTPWELLKEGVLLETGSTDEDGMVHIHTALLAGVKYELHYPGRTLLIRGGEHSPLKTVKGLQLRLALLGYPAGPADGVQGPRTTSALMEFQLDHNLEQDGIYGPKSQEKLAECCGF